MADIESFKRSGEGSICYKKKQFILTLVGRYATLIGTSYVLQIQLHASQS